jgi:hypothetical protein
MSKLLVDEISDADNTGPVTVTDGLIGDVTGTLTGNATGNLTGNVTGNINGLTPQASNMQPHNLIINGAMNVAQRGTSVSGVTSSGYNSCDRYKCNGNNGTWTISQDTDAPAGFSNSFKMLLTATETIGNTSYWMLEQKIEGQNLQQLSYGTSDAKTVTLSFYVKSNVTGTYCVDLYQDDGSFNFPVTYTIDTADTWEYKTIVFVGNTATALDNDNDTSLRTSFFVVAGSDYTSGTAGERAAYSDATFAAGHTAQVDAVNDYWQITGVQLEAGSTASSFAHENVADTLRKCQRYYQKYTFAAGTVITIGQCYSATNVVGSFQLNQEMRATPSITMPSAGYNVMSFLTAGSNWPSTFGSISASNISNINFTFSQGGASGYAEGNASWLYPAITANILADAEL